MNGSLALRKILYSGTALAVISIGLVAPSLADTSTRTLIDLLASKGVITTSEANTVRSAPPASQQERLVALLRYKGILEANDVKALDGNRPIATTAEPVAAPPTQLPPPTQPVRVASLDPNIGAAASPPPAQPAPATRVASADPNARLANLDAAARASVPRGDLKSPPMYTKSPLAVEMAGITITPLGFVDVTGVWRSRNTGNSTATNFGAIPFENTIQGNIGETRISAQNSRFALRAEGTYFDRLHLLGYVEGDFNGNDAANVFVTTNSHTMRLRQAFFDVGWDNWEFMGGQGYSWMTPNRHGMSPYPTDVFTTLNIDQSLQVGMPWTRAAQARIVYHATPNFQLGVAVENPDQFVGAGEVIFPFAFNASLGSQFDAANQTTVPNVAPDIIIKTAFDDSFYGHGVHLEAAGLVRQFKATDVPIGATDFTTHETTGYGTLFAGNVEVFKGFHLVGNAFWSKGGGRYLGGHGPDLVVQPNDAATDISLRTVESKAFLVGAEWWINPDTVVASYYGQERFIPNAFQDTTSPLVTKPFIGFGGPNSPNSANGKIQEATLDIRHTFWADSRFGAIEGLAQYSWVRRDPNFVATGAPENANVQMFFASMRYHLPGGKID